MDATGIEREPETAMSESNFWKRSVGRLGGKGKSKSKSDIDFAGDEHGDGSGGGGTTTFRFVEGGTGRDGTGMF